MPSYLKMKTGVIFWNRKVIIGGVVISCLSLIFLLTHGGEKCDHSGLKNQKPVIGNKDDTLSFLFTQSSRELTMEEMFVNSVRTAPHLYYYQGRLIIPPVQTLMFFTRKELEDLYHLYVENTQINCNHMIHYGLESDGGYYYCMDVGLRHPCMMYSFGTRNDYSFDDKIANILGCDVHSFDPGDGQEDHQRSERIWFHAIGLGGTTRKLEVDKGKSWDIYNLKDTRKLLKHEDRTLDILKIDTEGMIWETLDDITSGRNLDDVKLLIMELHINYPVVPDVPYEEYRTQKDYIEHLHSLRKLYDLGFRHYYFQRWFQCIVKDDDGRDRTGCHDVHYVNIHHLPYYDSRNRS